MQLIAAAMIGLIAIAQILRRGRSLWVTAFLCGGICCLVAAAGDFSWRSVNKQKAVVAVDLSGRTRGAAFRDQATLQRRIGELLGKTPYDLVSFSNANDLAAASMGNAVLLFSDGRSAIPAHPAPVYPVLDPMLENPVDASIGRMDLLGDQLAVSVKNNGPPRVLTLHGVTGPATQAVEGDQTIVRTVSNRGEKIWAELSPGDAWPENDAMSILPMPPLPTERWWIGTDSPQGWRGILPQDVPTEAGEYLSPAVIVLNNIAADDLASGVQDRLAQYVRDLGGSLVILGGSRAFAAGGYQGTQLESMSPLSSYPPNPQTVWILLADASGSMADVMADGQTRWEGISRALVDLLPRLPLNDLVRVGQFSDTLKWWSDGLTAGQTALLQLPPADALPHGPTNLQQALEGLGGSPGGMAAQIILLTDADVALTNTDAIASRLRAANMRLNLLAIERGRGLGELEDIVHDTGGSFITQRDASLWAAAARQLALAAATAAAPQKPILVSFRGAAASIPADTVFPWNRAWIKPGATPLADGDELALAAQWQFGSGRVLAAAFAAKNSEATALARLVEQAPGDPRLKVSWQIDATDHLLIDAFDGTKYLNDLDLSVEIWDQTSARRLAIPQTGPGRYELTLNPPAVPVIATVRMGGSVIDRTSIAGGYSAEFRGIGEDRPALQALADSTGGKVILPSQTTPIDFGWPAISYPLAPWFALAGAILLAAGLVAGKS